MSGNYYDVVVIGAAPGPLCAAALLAKRGFRVLVIGQDAYQDSYSCLDYVFIQRPFSLTGASSPAVSRVLEELSVSQLFSHAEMPREIKYQVVQPKSRVSVFGDSQKTQAELYREFGEYRPRLGGIFADIERYSRDFEKLVQNDLVIPADNFFERRDYSRAMVQHPFLSRPRQDFLEKLGVAGAFRTFFEAPLMTGMVPDVSMPPLVSARGLSAWLQDARALRNGMDGFRQIICERIIEQGGDVQPRYMIDSIGVSRGKVESVQLKGRKESVATRVVMTDMFPSQLSSLVSPGEWTSQFKALVDDRGDFLYGYSLNLGVRREVIPVGMADTVFLATGAGKARSAEPSVLRVEVNHQEDETRTALNVTCAVPESMVKNIDSGVLRDTILDRMRALIPYFDQYLEVIHSPYDSFGAIDLTGKNESGAKEMRYPEQTPRWLMQPPACFNGIGIENLPYRSGIKGLLMAGSQVNTGLGVESDLISAWGAAKIAGKMDPTRQKLVRAMRSKIEM